LVATARIVLPYKAVLLRTEERRLQPGSWERGARAKDVAAASRRWRKLASWERGARAKEQGVKILRK
jgi:hypothetical protein